MFPRFPERAAKQCFASLLRKQRNILRETKAANTRYYSRAMQNKHWNLINIVSSASKRGNICCGRKMFLRNIFCVVRNKCCMRGQTGKHLRPQQCFNNVLVCRGLKFKIRKKNDNASMKLSHDANIIVLIIVKFLIFTGDKLGHVLLGENRFRLIWLINFFNQHQNRLLIYTKNTFPTVIG